MYWGNSESSTEMDGLCIERSGLRWPSFALLENRNDSEISTFSNMHSSSSVHLTIKGLQQCIATLKIPGKNWRVWTSPLVRFYSALRLATTSREMSKLPLAKRSTRNFRSIADLRSTQQSNSQNHRQPRCVEPCS